MKRYKIESDGEIEWIGYAQNTEEALEKAFYNEEPVSTEIYKVFKATKMGWEIVGEYAGLELLMY